MRQRTAKSRKDLAAEEVDLLIPSYYQNLFVPFNIYEHANLPTQAPFLSSSTMRSASSEANPRATTRGEAAPAREPPTRGCYYVDLDLDLVVHVTVNKFHYSYGNWHEPTSLHT